MGPRSPHVTLGAQYVLGGHVNNPRDARAYGNAECDGDIVTTANALVVFVWPSTIGKL